MFAQLDSVVNHDSSQLLVHVQMILVFHSHHNSSPMILCFQMVLEHVVTIDLDMSKETHAVDQLHIHQKVNHAAMINFLKLRETNTVVVHKSTTREHSSVAEVAKDGVLLPLKLLVMMKISLCLNKSVIF